MAESVTLAVLAGGEGKRMGMPKAGLEVGGEPILRRLLRRLRWEGPTLLVTAPGRERPAGAEAFGREVADPVEGEGPLRGVMTALENCETELMVVVPVDMPEITREVLGFLVEKLDGARVAMLEREEGGRKRVEPLPMACRVEVVLPEVRRRYAEGRRALMVLSEGAVISACPAKWPAAVWTHLNYPEELVAYGQRERDAQ